MFIEKLPATTQATLVRVAQLPLPSGTYLAGGTAVSLHLGHRLSDDLDLFTRESFEPSVLVQALQEAGTFELERTSWGTILGWLNGVRFSLFFYRYPLLYPYVKFRQLLIADLRDIAAMKIAAISDRGSRKDFVDLYAICQAGVSLRASLKLYDRKYGTLTVNRMHLYKSLAYFDDAEEQASPIMLQAVPWKHVKAFFEREVRRLIRTPR